MFEPPIFFLVSIFLLQDILRESSARTLKEFGDPDRSVNRGLIDIFPETNYAQHVSVGKVVISVCAADEQLSKNVLRP